MGKIVKLHPGADGLVRVVTLRMKGGLFKRPIARLSPLPVECNEITEIQVEDASPKYAKEQEKASVNDRTVRKPQRKGKRRGAETHVSDGQRRSPRIQNKASFMLSILVGLFLTSLVGAESIHRFKHEPGLHFIETGEVQFIDNFWTISVQQNATEFDLAIQRINESIEVISASCLSTKMNCATYLDSLKWRKISMQSKLQMIKLKPSIRKRRVAPMIIVVGSIAAGIIGTSVYQQYQIGRLDTEMKELELRQGRLLALITNNTDAINVEASIMGMMQSEAQNTSLEIKRVLRETNTSLFQLNVKTQIHEVLLMSELVVAKLDKILEGILSVVTDREAPHSLTAALNMFNLNEYYSNISAVLPPNQKLPDFIAAEELLLYPSVTIEKEHVTFIFRIPIVSIDAYKLFTVLSMPIVQKEEMFWIKPSATKIALRNGNVKIPIDDRCHDIGQAHICESSSMDFDNEKLRCELAIWFHHRLHESCLMQSTNIADTWVQVNDDTWAFAVVHPIEIKINNETQLISGSGIISYHEKQIVEHINDTIIVAESHLLITPAVNASDWILTNFSLNAPTRVTKELEQLRSKLEIIRRAEEVEQNWDFRDTALHVGPYLLMILLLIIMVIIFCRLKSKPIVNHNKFFKDLS